MKNLINPSGMFTLELSLDELREVQWALVARQAELQESVAQQMCVRDWSTYLNAKRKLDTVNELLQNIYLDFFYHVEDTRGGQVVNDEHEIEALVAQYGN